MLTLTPGPNILASIAVIEALPGWQAYVRAQPPMRQFILNGRMAAAKVDIMFAASGHATAEILGGPAPAAEIFTFPPVAPTAAATFSPSFHKLCS